MILEIIGMITIAGLLFFVMRVTFNIVFLTLAKPLIWIGIMAAIGYLIVLTSTMFTNGVNLFSLPIVAMLFMPISISKKKDNSLSYSVYNTELLKENGIKRGVLLYRTGKVVYGIIALVSWVFHYATIE